jgi:hypothetical protein
VIGSVVNAIIQAFIDLLEVSGRTIFNWKDSLEDMKVDTDALGDSMDALAEGTWDAVEAQSEVTASQGEAVTASEGTAAAMDVLTESLTNVPTGFKVAQARFDSAAADAAELFTPLSGSTFDTLSGSGSVYIGHMPAFAEGAIVTGPTVALAGEAGPEAVIPLDRLDDFMGGGGGGIVINNMTVIANTPREFMEAMEREVSRKALTRSGFPALGASKFRTKRSA